MIMNEMEDDDVRYLYQVTFNMAVRQILNGCDLNPIFKDDELKSNFTTTNKVKIRQNYLYKLFIVNFTTELKRIIYEVKVSVKETKIHMNAKTKIKLDKDNFQERQDR